MDIKFLGNSQHNMVERKSVIGTIWGGEKREGREVILFGG